MIVRCHGRSEIVSSARTSVTCPFRGEIDATHRSSGVADRGARRQGSAVHARLDDGDSIGRDAKQLGHALSRRLAGDDDTTDAGQGASLADFERRRVLTRNAGLVGQGMVDERHETQPRGFALHERGHHAARESVHEDCGAVRNRRQRRRRFDKRGVRRPRKTVREVADVHTPAEPAQPLDDAPVVDVAAGRRVEASGDDETRSTSRRPSNDADATCDSCSVTRMLSTADAPVPSSPRPRAAATRSKIVRARTSVVVLRPLNAGSSSRLR